MELGQQLRQYIRDQSSIEVETEESLFDRGILDSMALMELIMFIEDRTGLKVPPEEVNPDNFETISRIEKLLDRLQA
jgi:acyl carrier protein